MPQDFLDCVAAGGRVRNKVNGDYRIPLCFDKAGKAHAGEAKHLKEPKERVRAGMDRAAKEKKG